MPKITNGMSNDVQGVVWLGDPNEPEEEQAVIIHSYKAGVLLR